MPQKACERCIFHVRPYVYFFEMPHFSFFILKMGKMSHFEKRHVTSFKTRNEPKMKFFEFGAFQNKMHMALREKYIFHMLFGVFHDTPRKMKFFDFGAFQNKRHMASRDKYIFHIHFGAFHGTPRINLSCCGKFSK